MEVVFFNFQQFDYEFAGVLGATGCIIQQPYEVEKGAGTMNPLILRALVRNMECRLCRNVPGPTDGRYGRIPIACSIIPFQFF
jgi:glycyl-tRNA synthetase alpha chain